MQVVNTQQLLDMAVSAMLGRSRRSLYTPLHYLAQHASERAEKLEACRQTSELDRLKVRALLLPSITSLMDKYGFDDRNGECSHMLMPAADAHFSRSEPGDDGGFVGGTPEGAGSKAAGPARAQPASPGAAPAAQLAAIERKLDLLLGGLAATRSEGRELRASLERLERRMAAALPPDEPWAEAEDGRAPGWQAQAQGGSQSLY
ncbi:hypothetical protein T492DRAFT_867251 [Pavlovales sp. CCMP2436]|nr:hypothetical protein T492DRAFT_867251 [Pavlovales sp. CCMP2436]